MPLWAQLLDDLVRRLESSAFDRRFPSEHDLVAEYGVSRHTVREALRRLRESGAITSNRGRLTVVRTASIEQPLGALYSLFREVEGRGMEQRSEVRARDVRRDADAAAVLELPEAAELVYIERLRYADGEPLAWDRTWMPTTVGARYTLQPGITDVKSQVQSMAPWVSSNLGKKVTMIFPDYAFGHDHRDFFTAAMAAQGGEVIQQIAIPPTETSFFKYFPQVPSETEVLYHVMVGPAVLTFVKEMGEFYGSERPEIFGFIDSLEAVDIKSPGLEFLEGTYFWEGMPRYAGDASTEFDAFYREHVGVDVTGASVSDSKDIATFAHMFGCWETLHVIKAGMEAADYQGPDDRAKLIEAVEAMTEMPASEAHPQGDKLFNGKTHQVFGHQYISQVEEGALKVVHTTSIEDGQYPDEVDYTTQPL
jgi:DNA-binding GntR family transcriptional regulator